MLRRFILEDGYITHQIFIVVICNWIIELSLQVNNDSDYTHTARSTGNENVYVINGARLLNGGLQEFRVCYLTPR